MRTPPRTIYPEPKKAVWKDGFLSFENKAFLSLPENSENADFFIKTWENFTCGKLETVLKYNPHQDKNSFLIWTEDSPCEFPKLEEKSAYALNVTPGASAATALDNASLKQAWFSMLQMLAPKPGTREIEGYQIPCVEIQDYPLLKFRCAHLCVFPETTLNFLEKMLNLLAMNKFSHVVIEFWGMLKLEALPELAWPQAYSKDQIKPLLQWTRDLGLEPIPMFNHWGHATSSRVACGRHSVLDQNPLKAPLFEPDGWTWCLTNPESLKILSEIRNELIELFGDINYFHMGCDEAYSHATCDNCRKEDPPELFARFLNSVNDDLKSRNIRPFIWGDALLEYEKWEGYIALSRKDQRTHESLDMLSKDFIIADWQYYLKDGEKETETLKHFMSKGFDTVTAPWHNKKNIDACGEMAIKENAFGMMHTTWHTLPMNMRALIFAGSIMWGGEKTGLENPQYYSGAAQTSMAAFLRRIRNSPIDYADAGWRSVEVTEMETS